MSKTIPVTIEGVEVKELVSHKDERGFFREIIRANDPIFTNTGSYYEAGDAPAFMQWSHSKMEKDTVKAWHYHHKQIDWWYIGLGDALVGLVDNRPESPTYKEKMVFTLSGEPESEGANAVIKIPTGVLHGCRILSEFASLFYITSEIYDTKDEGRIPYNDPSIDHDWGEEDEIIVAKNDKRFFEPEYERRPIR